MAKKPSTVSDAERALQRGERAALWQQWRRRLVGALAVGVATWGLWKVGGEAPPAEALQMPPSAASFASGEALASLGGEALAWAGDEMVALLGEGFFGGEDEAAVTAVAAVTTTLAAQQVAMAVTLTAGIAADVSATAISATLTASAAPVLPTQKQPVVPAAPVTRASKKAPETKAAAVKPPPPPPPAPPAPKPTAIPDNKYYVLQAGAYAAPAAARAAAVDIERGGFAARLTESEKDGKKLWRVQAINVRGRAAVSQAQKKLAQLGYPDAHIVAKSASALPSAPVSPYILQVGAFAKRSSIDRALNYIEKIGMQAQTKVLKRGGRKLYRVIAIGAATEAEARALQKQFRAAGFADTVYKKR